MFPYWSHEFVFNQTGPSVLVVILCTFGRASVLGFAFGYDWWMDLPKPKINFWCDKVSQKRIVM